MNIRAAALCLLLAATLPGCSSDDEAAPPPASSPAASAAASAATTSAATTTAAATSAPASSAPEAADAPDVEGVAYGLLTAFAADGGLRYDKVDYLPQACDGRTDEEFGDPEATLRVCFRNVNPLIRSARTSPDLLVGTYLPDGSVLTEDDEDAADLRQEYEQGFLTLPVRLTVTGGVVTRIDKPGLLAG